MIDKDIAKQIIDEHLDISRLRRIIVDTSAVAWGNHINDNKIDKWISNFTGSYFASVESEQKLALWLLHNYTFYTEKDVRILCRKLFDLILHRLIIDKKLSASEAKNEIIKEGVFVGLGHGGESSQQILYKFRQETSLPNNCFDETRKNIKDLFLVDDVSISGEQAEKNIKKLFEKNTYDAENIYICLLIDTDIAIKRLGKSYNSYPVISPIVLDSRDKAFSPDSYVFSHSKLVEIKQYAQEFCEYYGSIAVKNMGYMESYPLGFDNGQYLFGFSYNTPDNTLPIFWGFADGWIPLFKRYHKILSNGKEIALDERIYY